jgi:hypothetical protein
VEVLPADATDETVLAAVAKWINLLAADDAEAAVAFLHHGQFANPMATSPDALRSWLARYEPGPPLRPGPPRVTPVETAGGPFEPRQEVWRDEAGNVVSVDYSIPVNGEWSELVAFFDLVRVPEGAALLLRDIYVA